jgi:hypothetical protein
MKTQNNNTYKLKIWECNSKGQEKIADIFLFNTIEELREYVKNINLEMKPYKMNKKTKGYSITA